MVTLNSMFENTSGCYSSNSAVTFNSGITTKHITYGELDAEASQVAEFLDTLCEGEKIIAIYSKQSIGLMSCILGVLKCGRCFAPIDLNWPPDMVCKFLLKLNVSHILVDKELLGVFQKSLSQWKTHLQSDCQVELISNQALDANGFLLVRRAFELKGDTERAESLGLAYVMQTSGTTGEAKAVKVPHRCIVPNVTDLRRAFELKGDTERAESLGLAYVMQTSGTTGEAKAVKVPHRCIVPNVTDLRDIFQVTPDDVVFLASPYTFDPFIVQMFLAFSTGARLVIVPDNVKTMPSKLVHILFDEERVTILQPTPSLMYHIGQDLIRSKVLTKDSSLRVLAFGGESCPTLSTLRQWRPSKSNSSIYNLYGITEVSCWASCHHIRDIELLEKKSGACQENVTSQSKELENCLIDEVNDVPLGVPLSDTIIEVRDENGKLVQEGIGQIYIGGSLRVCLLGNQTSLTVGTMRATGDWAYVKDCCIWFCGRRDRQIKRMGKRINLDWIESQITEKLLGSACSLVFEKTGESNYSRLHLFIVAKPSSYDNNELSLKRHLLDLLPVEARPDCVHVVSHLPMTAHGKIDRGSVLAGVQKTTMFEDVKSTREFLKCVWNEVLELNKLGNTERVSISSSSETSKGEPGNFREISKEDIKEDDMFIASGGSSFDAIRLADLIESFVSKQKKTAVDLPGLLDVILNKPFYVLCNYVDGILTGTDKRDGLTSKGSLSELLNEDSSHDSVDATADPQGSTNGVRFTNSTRENHLNKETIEEVNVQHGSEFQSKMNTMETKTGSENKEICTDLKPDIVFSRQATILSVKRKSSSLAIEASSNDKKTARTEYSNKDEICSLSELKSCFCSVRSRNQWTICEFCKYSTLNTTSHVTDQTSVQSSRISCEAMTSSLKEKIPHQPLASLKDDKSPGTCVAYEEITNVNNAEQKFKVSITCQWKTCLYECIDASPLVVCAQGRSDGEVFIGSHGHVFMCVRLSDGKVLWESKVGDRIESSAALSKCGGHVIVGCYDGKLYVFNRFTGETLWTFQTGAAVKSSPSIDPLTGVAWVGSHDHHLYGLDVTNKQCVCAIDCGGGSCFSSPCISNEPHLVFIATLTGRLLAVDAAEHTILWSQQCPKPVFASPLLTPSGIICACVDGFVYCFDFKGNKLWCFQTRASLFSSPTYFGAEYHSTSRGYIVFGSHDKRVYCLSLNGELQWSFTTDGKIYSSPFVAELNANHLTDCQSTCHASQSDKMAVFVLSTVGTLYVVDLRSGDLLASHTLPGEVFSSPVVVNKRVLIGCRNDYLHSLELSNRKNGNLGKNISPVANVITTRNNTLQKFLPSC